MSYDNPNEKENIAQTLVKVLPQPVLLFSDDVHGGGSIQHVAVPSGYELKSIDDEKLLQQPRHIKALASLSNAESFVEYVNRHQSPGSTVWTDLNPQTFALKFQAVLDEHGAGSPQWRRHVAQFHPDFSAEWKAWTSKNAKTLSQIEFAEWIEEHADDFTSADGFPTSLELMKMALDFKMNEERTFKSKVSLKSGGVRLAYVADPETGNMEDMVVHDKFAIGIPVFHGCDPWRINCRLKFRMNSGSVSFFYELVRHDKVHQNAAMALISDIKETTTAKMLFGFCN